MATCWAQGGSGTPTLPAQVMNQDTQALLDTGSIVTLLHSELAGGKKGEPLEVACVHGDTRTYETCHVVIRTPHGVFTARAGVVPHLPVRLLIGRDCPIFHRLWNPEREARARRHPVHRGQWKVRPAYGATRVQRTPEESTAEDQGSEVPSGPDRLGPPLAPRIPSRCRNRLTPLRDWRAHPSVSFRTSSHQGGGEPPGPGSSPAPNSSTRPWSSCPRPRRTGQRLGELPYSPTFRD